MSSSTVSRPQRRPRSARAVWIKTLHQWHWISSALCLVGMILFSVTGITLNHAGQIEARPSTFTLDAQLPEALREALQDEANAGVITAPIPEALGDWLRDALALGIGKQLAEWNSGEIYLALPRPGGDAWLSVDLDSGAVAYERTDRGWIAYLNDLHKGRNTGVAWSWFIDLFAVATLVFCLTGLFLLHLHARQRRATWPVVALGVVIPVFLLMFFLH